MVEQELFEVEGKKLIFKQAETIEEAKKAGFPEGVYFCWQHGDETIYSPGVIIQMVQKGVIDESFKPQKLVQNTGEFYKNLVETQRNNILKHLQELKSDYVKNKVPKEAMKLVDDMIKQYNDKFPFPDQDGIFRPDLKQATDIAGGKEELERFYDKKFSEAVFGNKQGE